MSKLLKPLGVLLMLAGIAWIIRSYYLHGNEVLTYAQQFIINWPATALLIVGWAFISVGNEYAKEADAALKERSLTFKHKNVYNINPGEEGSGYTVNDFIAGDTVVYVPRHLHREMNDTDYEPGVVVSKNDTYIFVRYWKNDVLQETAQSTDPNCLWKPS
jgi:hypothetical protein